MHGGRIEARSDGLGKGSEFIVRLPLLAGEPAPELRPSYAAPQPAARRRILVAEDERDGAESLAALLRLNHHQVAMALDGLQAVEAAERERPEVILLDLGMPGLDGYAVCRQIRAQPWGRTARIVAVTGWGQDENRRRTAEAGFDDHLVKPVEPARLLTLLSQASDKALQ
jgi:CheY-like chemotaxis protein